MLKKAINLHMKFKVSDGWLMTYYFWVDSEQYCLIYLSIYRYFYFFFYYGQLSTKTGLCEANVRKSFIILLYFSKNEINA